MAAGEVGVERGRLLQGTSSGGKYAPVAHNFRAPIQHFELAQRTLLASHERHVDKIVCLLSWEECKHSSRLHAVALEGALVVGCRTCFNTRDFCGSVYTMADIGVCAPSPMELCCPVSTRTRLPSASCNR